jgi:23S rRNA pseudouridine2457 synthase
MVTDTSGLYPAGRLDHDSEGLLLLTNYGPWQARISHPRHKLNKTYLAQVEGDISDEAITRLLSGVILKDGPAHALTARRITDLSDISERNPPVRFRASIPTSWLELTINEGRNRQVRRMTAAVGFPTLRLIRTAVGPWQLSPLAPGESMEIARKAVVDVLG